MGVPRIAIDDLPHALLAANDLPHQVLGEPCLDGPEGPFTIVTAWREPALDCRWAHAATLG